MTYLLFVLLLSCTELRAQFFNCRNGEHRSLALNSTSIDFWVFPQKEKFYFSSGVSCNWDFTLYSSVDRILLLNGDLYVDLSRLQALGWKNSYDPSAPRMAYRLTADSNCAFEADQSWHRVELTTVDVLRLPKRAIKLCVKYHQMGTKVLDSTPGLRVRVMEQGYCNREVVGFKENCYATSRYRRNVKELITSACRPGELKQLASFRSASDLQSFVNESKRTVYGCGMDARGKNPLNLTQPVRIGLFYDRSVGSVYYLDNNNGQLQINLFPDRQHLHSTYSASSRVSCAALRIAHLSTDSFGTVDFGDCNQPLPALLSFPDSGTDCCGGCIAQAVLDFIDNGAPADTTDPTTAAPPSGTDKYYVPFIVVLILFLILFIPCIIYILVRCIKRQSIRRWSEESQPLRERR